MLSEEKRVYDDTLHGSGTLNPYEVRDRLQEIMDKNAYVFRTAEGLRTALRQVQELKEEAYRRVTDQAKEYNTSLVHVLELDSLLETAEIMLVSALAREESRGAHSRLDYPKRDDENWLKHTLAHKTSGLPKLDYLPVKITKYPPVERRY